VAGVIHKAGLPVQYPSFDTASSTIEKLQALRNIITQSQALLCYWATADGRGLEKRLEQDGRRQFKAKAWYLGPPLDLAGKEKLRQSAVMVLQQKAADVDVATLEPFLIELGWRPA
jgi:hypothetical protein